MQTLPVPSDAQLVDATRRGSGAAWDELESRHVAAVAAVARARGRRRPEQEARDALTARRRELEHDAAVPDGAAAVRAFGPTTMAALGGEDTSVRPVGGDDSDLAAAFLGLPEPWQTVLWYTACEDRKVAEAAIHVGRSTNDVAALRRVARRGLYQACLDLRTERAARTGASCADVLPLLGARARSTLSERDRRAVELHLADDDDGSGCGDCAAAVELAGRLDDELARAIVPQLTGLDVARFRSSIGSARTAPATSELAATRSARVRRMAAAGISAAVVLSLVAAALVIRQPFDGTGSVSTRRPATDPAGGSTGQPIDDGAPEAVSEGAPGTDPSVPPPAPTTTELELRPDPTGPANTMSLTIEPGSRALGAVATDLDVGVSLSSPAPVFAGGTGTIDVALANRSDVRTAAVMEVAVPRGMVFDGLLAGPAECVDPDDAAPFCNLALPADEEVIVTLRFRLESSLVGRLVVDAGPEVAPLEIAIEVVPQLIHSSVGRGSIEVIGNTVMSCAETADACADAREGVGDVVNRWDLPMQYLGAVPELGWANSSTATLDLGGAAVDAAYLFWSGDLSQRDATIDDGSQSRVNLIAPGAELPATVEADRVRLGDIDATQYLGFADVTDLVSAGGSGVYFVGNVQTVEVQGSYGGWALVVVTADSSAPRRQHLVTSPFAWFSPDHEYTGAIPVPFTGVGGPVAGHLGVVGFEGEPGFEDGALLVDDAELGGGNPFDSSISGDREPSHVNNFGVDIDAYALGIDAPDGSLPIHATSSKDGVRLAVLGLSVDVPS